MEVVLEVALFLLVMEDIVGEVEQLEGGVAEGLTVGLLVLYNWRRYWRAGIRLGLDHRELE